jgi:cardiolipin synthase
MIRNRKPGLIVTCLIALWILTGCAPSLSREKQVDQVQACLAGLYGPPGSVTGVFVEPDDGRDPILDELNHAQCSIDIAVYLLTDEKIIAAIEATHARGVRVRLILEEDPFGGGGGQDELVGRLRPQGIEIKWSDSEFRFTHAKYIVVDRQIALILNLNLTVSAFEGNREFGAVTTHSADVQQAQSIFDRDWSGNRSATENGPLIVSPANSRVQYLSLIADAKVSITFYAEVIRDDEILTALGLAVKRGVHVRTIVNLPETAEDSQILARLRIEGVEVRASTSAYIHAKLMVIDGQRAIVGSQNFTATSLDSNREIAMLFDDSDAVARCRDIFESDWTRARIEFTTVRGILLDEYEKRPGPEAIPV